MVITEREITREKRAKDENKAEKKDKPATKVVIRRLPPSTTQEEFLDQVSPIPSYNYIYTIKGDNSLGSNAFARVYVNFVSSEDIYLFKEKFDNYVFVDGNGHEYAAVVEYAAFQKVPKRRKQRADPKVATIELDPAYIAFLETLNEQPNQEEKPEYNLNLTNTENKNDFTTPLLDYLKQRKAERQRVREEKREERRRKEQEKKKLREEDKKKRIEEKKQRCVAHKEAKKEHKDRDNEKENKHSPDTPTAKDASNDPEAEPEAGPTSSSKARKEKADRVQKTEKSFKNRNKFDEKKQQKNKFKCEDRKEVRSRRDDFREREQPKAEQPKKVKKYSERREERRNVEAIRKDQEAKRAESGKKTPNALAKEPRSADKGEKARSEDETSSGRPEEEERVGKKHKEGDPRSQRRIRNKDRPAMQIYKPGMLRKKSVDYDKDIVMVGDVQPPEHQDEPAPAPAAIT